MVAGILSSPSAAITQKYLSHRAALRTRDSIVNWSYVVKTPSERCKEGQSAAKMGLSSKTSSDSDEVISMVNKVL